MARTEREGMDEQDDLDLVPMNRGRYRPILIGLGVVAVGAVAAVLINNRLAGSRRTDALARAGTAWSQLRRCLVGDGPPRGEHVAAFVRRLELGLPASERDPENTARGNAWPYRCARPANVLTHAIFESGSADDRHRVLAMMASRASTALENGELHTGRQDRQAYLDELFAAAEQAELPAGEPATNLPPGTAARPLTSLTMNAVYAGAESAGVAGTEPVVHRERAQVVVGTSRFRVCTFTAGSAGDGPPRPLATVRCQDVPSPATTAPELVASEAEGAPWVRAHAPTGESALYRIGTSQPVLREGRGGYDNAAGVAAALREVPAAGGDAGAPRWELAFAPAEGSPARAPVAVTLPPSAGAHVWGPALVGDRVVLVVPRVETPSADAGVPGDVVSADASVDAAADGAHDAGDAGDAGTTVASARAGTLWAAQLPSGDGPLALTEVGPLPAIASDAHVQGCAMASGPAFVFPAAGDRSAVVFANGAALGRPIEGDAPERATLGCRADALTLTWTEVGAVRRLHQLRCTPQGCTAAQSPMPDFDGQALVADLDGRVIVVGTPRGGGLRMRIGEMGQVHRAEEVTVVDDADHGGLALMPLRALVARGDSAVVLVTNTAVGEETYAIRLEASGAFAPVRAASVSAPRP